MRERVGAVSGSWRAGVLAGLALAVTLVAGACGHGGTGQPAQAQPSIPVILQAQGDDEGVEPSDSPSPTPSHKASTKPSASGKPNAYATYGVSYTVATGGTNVVGPSGGTLKRYEVSVQNGLSESPATVAAKVDQILGNSSRGWLHGGQWRFQRVSSGPVDFIVELTSASNTEMICAKFGLDTGGVVSCRGGKNVVINETRWRTGTDGVNNGKTAYSPADYQVLVINHEVGHALGHSHVTCAGSGKPAAVMMTQYYGLNGCVPNIWPYTADGNYVN
jgi:Protein of unknown function (DUF3152)